MKIRQTLLKKLCSALPVGYGRTLQERLHKKGHDFSIPYIYRVLSPRETDFNTIIVEEAVEYLHELNELRRGMESRIEQALA
jgi:hypothetical protein